MTVDGNVIWWMDLLLKLCQTGAAKMHFGRLLNRDAAHRYIL